MSSRVGRWVVYETTILRDLFKHAKVIKETSKTFELQCPSTLNVRKLYKTTKHKFMPDERLAEQLAKKMTRDLQDARDEYNTARTKVLKRLTSV